MTAGGILYAMLSLRRDGAPTPWETCATVLRAVAGRFDVVAITPPGSYFARSLRDRIPRDQLFLHAPAESADISAEFGDESGIPIVLGENERNRHAHNMRLWPPAAPEPTYRRRRVDTLYSDSHRIGLLVLDCPSSTVSVLRGAARVLETHRPSILVDFTTVPQTARAAIWEACVSAVGLDYIWYDGMLLPCETPGRREEALLGCATRAACAIPRNRAAESGIPLDIASLLTPELREFAELSWTDWQDSMLVDPARLDGISVAFDRDLPCTGLYPAETYGADNSWRWSGPGVRSTFVMPLPAPGSWRVRLNLFDWGVASGRRDIRMHAPSRVLPMQESDNYTAVFGPLTVPPLRAASAMRIEVMTPPPRRASTDDPRPIGICMQRCTLERA